MSCPFPCLIAYQTHFETFFNVGTMTYAKLSKFLWMVFKVEKNADEASSSSLSSLYEPRHEISNNVVCATSKGSDQPAHTPILIRAFASRLNIL